MSPEREKLISDYIDGRASETDVRQLESLLMKDAAACREFLLASAMEVQLRDLLSSEASERAGSARRSHMARWMMSVALAALIALTLGGWTATVMLAHRSNADRDRIEGLRAELARRQAVPAQTALSPEIIDTKGLVLSLPEGEDSPRENSQAVQLGIGDAMPAGRALWTCPWGGVGTRYPDGTVVTLERSTTAAFTEGDGVREVHLTQGVLIVKRWPEKAGRDPMLVKTPQATATITDGQLVMAIVKGQTVVEVGMGKARVVRAGDGKSVVVPNGYYAVVSGEGELTATRGVLQWRLEPRPSAAQ